jgi:hypothetical protein
MLGVGMRTYSATHHVFQGNPVPCWCTHHHAAPAMPCSNTCYSCPLCLKSDFVEDNNLLKLTIRPPLTSPHYPSLHTLKAAGQLTASDTLQLALRRQLHLHHPPCSGGTSGWRGCAGCLVLAVVIRHQALRVTGSCRNTTGP